MLDAVDALLILGEWLHGASFDAGITVERRLIDANIKRQSV